MLTQYVAWTNKVCCIERRVENYMHTYKWIVQISQWYHAISERYCIVDKIRPQYFQKYNHIYSNFPEANTANDDFHGCVYRSVGDVIVLHFLNYVYVFIILYQFSLLLSIKSVLNKNLKCPEKKSIIHC